MWVPACDILSLHFSALPSHHKTQQETGSLPLPTLFLHEFFLLLIAHIFPLSYSKFQIFFSITHRPKTTYTMANSEPTTVNIINGHKTERKKKIQPSTTTIKRKKFQSSIPPPTTQTHLHHSPSFKPQLQTQKTQTHQHKIFRSMIQNC